MARIRNLGELTYSPFHNLPYQAEEPAYFQLLIDDNLWETGNELQRKYPAAWKDEESTVHGDSVWAWLLNSPLPSLTDECAILFDGIYIHFQTSGGGSYRRFWNFTEVARFVQRYGLGVDILGDQEWSDTIGCLRILSHLPFRLGIALAILSKKLTIKVEALDSHWDFGEKLGRRTFLLSIVPERRVENTDKFLQSFARKLNQALRTTTQ